MRHLIICATLVLAPLSASAIPAFPGAEGMGAQAEGGRGGAVFIVDSLADSGAGTLRECVEASGPRTCVFRVAGDIVLQDWLRADDGFLTIAGQTAPGQGVQLRLAPTGSIRTPLNLFAEDGHFIVTHLKIRNGPTNPDSDHPDCIQVGGVETQMPENVIIANVSCSFSTDEALSTNPPADLITLQDNLVAYPLRNASHPQGAHARPMNIRECGVSMLRNYVAHGQIRMWNNTCGNGVNATRGDGGSSNGQVNAVNNVIYNAQQFFVEYWNGRGDSFANFVNNTFIRGADTFSGALNAPYGVEVSDFEGREHPVGFSAAENGFQSLCLQGNRSEELPGPNKPAPSHEVLNPDDVTAVVSLDCENNPTGPWGWHETVLPESGNIDRVVATAGAIWWDRDTLDQRAVDDLVMRTGNIIDDPSEVGGWPVLTTGTPYLDADSDGMDDAWEQARGLDPGNPADRNALAASGYTQLEDFLHELGHYTAVVPPTAEWLSASGATTEPGLGTIPWSDPGNITVDDDVVAQADAQAVTAQIAEMSQPLSQSANMGAMQTDEALRVILEAVHQQRLDPETAYTLIEALQPLAPVPTR